MSQKYCMIYDDEGATVVTITDLNPMSTKEFQTLVEEQLNESEFSALYDVPFTGIVVAKSEQEEEWFKSLKYKSMTFDEWIAEVKNWTESNMCYC